jgi:translation initiation factor 2B subunit (eIF-2B alpha/beta/delta family)
MFGLTPIDKLVIDLSRDNTSGASQLVRRAVGIFKAVAEEHDEGNEDYLRTVVSVGRKVIRAQPSMAPIFNCVNDLLCTLESVPPYLAKDATNNWADAYIVELDKARDRVVASSSKALMAQDIVITHSYSSLVLKFLTDNAKKSFSVIISEGRPMNEGMKMAEALGLAGIQTTLVVDAALPDAVQDADMVLVGADSVTERGLVNKVGTKALALAAKAEEVPFFVAAERNKFVLSAFFIPEIQENTPLEITHQRFNNVKVRNIYFDETPLRLVSGFLTEDGARTVEDVMGYLRGRKISKEILAGESDESPPEPIEPMDMPEDL